MDLRRDLGDQGVGHAQLEATRRDEGEDPLRRERLVDVHHDLILVGATRRACVSCEIVLREHHQGVGAQRLPRRRCQLAAVRDVVLDGLVERLGEQQGKFRGQLGGDLPGRPEDADLRSRQHR